jgi:hypothetical protein
MKFKLPFRAMYRPPRNTQGAEVDRRAQGSADAQTAAQELANNPDNLALWKAGREKELLAVCKRKEFEVGQPAYTTSVMIYTALKGLLRAM